MLQVCSLSEVATALKSLGAKRISIDGTDGSGKSTLAEALSTELGSLLIHLDDFVEKGQGVYVSSLDIAELTKALTSAQTWILEGVCVLQALEAAGIEQDALVYIKRMSHGQWCDEDELDPQVPIEQHLDHLRSELRPFADAYGESGELGLAEEVVRYHARYRPHRNATLTYLRADA